jgi:hypothetical protein
MYFRTALRFCVNNRPVAMRASPIIISRSAQQLGEINKRHKGKIMVPSLSIVSERVFVVCCGFCLWREL